MRNKVIRYSVIVALIAFLGFKSVYFRRLDEVNTNSNLNAFDAGAYARALYKDKVPAAIDSAVDLKSLVALLRTDPDQAIKRYSHSLAIGNICYFLVRGEGTLGVGTDTGYALDVKDLESGTAVYIATEFVYGNAIRDASGLIRLSDFNNTAELNSISEQINNIIRNEVIPPFIANASEGSTIQFAGAIELNRKYLDLDTIEVVPIQLAAQ